MGPKSDKSNRGMKMRNKRVDSALPMKFMMNRKTELFHSGCNILGGFANLTFPPESI